MNTHRSICLKRHPRRLAAAQPPQAGHPRLIGAAVLAPPAPFGARMEAELLLVADPLPGRRHRPSRLETAGGLRLGLRWKSRASLAYPSPLYLQILQRGAILYDPEGLLEKSLSLLLEGPASPPPGLALPLQREQAELPRFEGLFPVLAPGFHGPGGSGHLLGVIEEPG